MIARADPQADPLDLVQRPWKPKTAADFGRAVSKTDQYRRLAEIRAADPHGIGVVPLDILRDQVDIVHRAMDAFFARVKAGQTPGFPRFKSYDRVRSFGCPTGQGISLRSDKLLAPMLWHGGIGVHMHRDLPGSAKTIRLTYDGRFWWVTVVCEVEVDAVAHPHPGTSIGLNAGVNNLLAFDDGTLVPNPKHQEEDAARVRRLARALSRCRRGSYGRNKAKRALARARKRTANRRATHHHKVSRDVVPISQPLKDAIAAWCMDYERSQFYLGAEDRTVDFDVGPFNARGEELADMLRKELPDWKIVYRPE